MARPLNKEQRGYLTDKVFKAAEEKLAPIREIDNTATTKANLVLAQRAFRKLTYMSFADAHKNCHENSRAFRGPSIGGVTFSFSVTVDNKNKDSAGGINTDVPQDSWRKRHLDYTGPKSKQVAEKLVKIINNFHGELIMQDAEGFETFMSGILEQIKKIK